MEAAETLDVIVVGAGAAGLVAARNLAEAGLRVAIVEARGRIGGRILTRRPTDSPPLELGPEFSHGENEDLSALFREAEVDLAPAPENQWVFQDGRLEKQDDLWDRITAVFRQQDPKTFPTFGGWLRHAPDTVPVEDQRFAREFVEGFHAAPVEAMSARTLRDTMGGADEEDRRVVNGYDRIILALAEQCYTCGVQIHLNAVVAKIQWQAGRVEVTLRGDPGEKGALHFAKAALVTVPLGVLKAQPGQLGAIRFEPELTAKRATCDRLQMGYASRLALRFRADFWAQEWVPEALRASQGRAFGFVHAPRQAVPVWWSHAPAPVLIGWAGGPAARKLAGKLKEEVVRVALQTLAEVFGAGVDRLAASLVDAHWHDWGADPFCRGAYSFSAAQAEEDPARLAAPVENTIFFAGEACAPASELGTVGGAVSSGRRAAQLILAARGSAVDVGARD